jgi:hypothetical protein
MRTRWTILTMLALSAAVVLARPGPAPEAAATPAAAVAADTTSTDMPTIEVLLPRDDRAELYQAVLELTARVEELQARVVRLEAELYVKRTELPGR